MMRINEFGGGCQAAGNKSGRSMLRPEKFFSVSLLLCAFALRFFPYGLVIRSAPPRYGRSASGIITLPSACW